MAIYHLHTKTFSRSQGHSAVAAAAYRAGDKLHDARRGGTHDYRRRSGVLATVILAPPQSPAWASHREPLWNTCEAIERRKDSCVARELEVALPRELDHAAHVALVTGFVREQLTARGLVADVAFHTGDARDGGANPHAHILMTTRPLRQDGHGFGKKDRGLDRPDTLKAWRTAWSAHVNRALADAGEAARVDHRTLAAQGIAWRAPLHLNHTAHILETRHGVTTEQGAQWRETRHRNGLLADAPPPDMPVVLAAAARLTPAQARTHQLLSLAGRALLGRGD